jgi:hypothetical protein
MRARGVASTVELDQHQVTITSPGGAPVVVDVRDIRTVEFTEPSASERGVICFVTSTGTNPVLFDRSARQEFGELHAWVAQAMFEVSNPRTPPQEVPPPLAS